MHTLSADVYYGTDNDFAMFHDTISNYYIKIYPNCNTSNRNISHFLDPKYMDEPVSYNVDHYEINVDTQLDKGKREIQMTKIAYNYHNFFDKSVCMIKSKYNDCGYASIMICKEIETYDLFRDDEWANSFKDMELIVLNETNKTNCNSQ
jgi:hypothetical protein